MAKRSPNRRQVGAAFVAVVAGGFSVLRSAVWPPPANANPSKRHSITDFLSLVSDTKLTYASGKAGTATSGDFVDVQKEGYSYGIAPPLATDHHLATTGGVKLYFLPGKDGFNVKAFGDAEAADASSVIQAAIDAAHAAFKGDLIPRTVFYPQGGTYMCRLLRMMPGVDHLGGDGATLKKTPAEGRPELVTKWWRILQVSPSDWDDPSLCFHRVRVENLIFDGNLAEMGWTENSYRQEHAHCLFITGPKSPVSTDHRVRVHVRACTFRNNTGDGLSLYVNTDAIVEQIKAENCFRGGFVATGGNSRVTLRGYEGENARVDIEIDGAGFGGSYSTDFDLEDIVIDQAGGGRRPGGIDIGGSMGGAFRVANAKVYSAPFNFFGAGGGATRVFEDCTFTVGGVTASSNRIVHPVDSIWSNCTFVVKPDAGITHYRAVHVYPRSARSATMEWRRCRFVLDPSVKTLQPGATCFTIGLQASYLSEQKDNGKVRYIFRDCESIGAWDRDVHIQQGGTVEIHGGAWTGAEQWMVAGGRGRPAQLTLSGYITLKPSVLKLFVESHAGQPPSHIRLINCTLSRRVEAAISKVSVPIEGACRIGPRLGYE